MTGHVKPRVLVVEDSDHDYYAFQRACRPLQDKARFERVVDVPSARAYLHQYETEQSPRDLAFILLDLNLPGTDGRTFLRELKADERHRRLPVVVFSTSGDPTDVTFCYEHHANAYHQKALDYSDLRDQVQSIVSYWTEAVLGSGDG